MKLKDDMKWMCGKCGKKYDTEQLCFKLKRVKAVKKDTNPMKQHGYHPVCKCGYEFHKDKWRLQKNLLLKARPKLPTFLFNRPNIPILVSAVFLELNHFGYWYELAVFNDSYRDSHMTRYITKKEAKKEYREILNKIKKGEYKFNWEEDYGREVNWFAKRLGIKYKRRTLEVL